MIASIPDRGVDIHVTIPLVTGWELASSTEPLDHRSAAALRFAPAKVPGTVASALCDGNSWRFGAHIHFDAGEHWFRCRFSAEPAEPGEVIVLRLGGIATVAEVFLNSEKILESSSMFAAHDLDISSLVSNHNELLIVCRSLTDAMRERRRRLPVARWKTRVVTEQQLRWFRTTLLGRAPGFAAEPEPVGPWRPVTLIRQRRIAVNDWTRQTILDGAKGTIRMQLSVRSLDSASR